MGAYLTAPKIVFGEILSQSDDGNVNQTQPLWAQRVEQRRQSVGRSTSGALPECGRQGLVVGRAKRVKA
jgi:hypothetical protein